MAPLLRGAFYLLLLLTFCLIPFALAQRNSATRANAQVRRPDRSPTALSGGVYEAWVARYNGPGNGFDEAKAIAVDNSGNTYVAGTSFGSGTIMDYATIKYNSAGQQEWVARYNGPDNGDDQANAMVVDASGNVYVTGGSGAADWLSDCTTIKYNPAGQEQWVARRNVCPRGYAWGAAIAVDASGDVYVTGVDAVGWVTIKYNLAGEEQWIAYHNSGGPVAIALDESGNVYVTGSDYDYVTIKYDSAGQEQWVARYNGPGNADDHAAAIAVDESGNVYVTGSSDLPGTSYDYATVKYNLAGEEQWVARYGESSGVYGSASAIAVDESGNVHVTGKINDPETYPDYGTIQYNSVGQQQWVARYNGPPGNASDYAVGIAIDGGANVYVTGSSQTTAFFSDYDYETIKYDSAGHQQWIARYNGPGDADDRAIGIAVDHLGNIYVTGTSSGYFATVKYGQGPTPTPTATTTTSPTPTSTPTPTATATASPTPTAMCSPTPTATASPSPTPSSPGSPIPTPTATATSTVTPPRRPTPRPRPTLPPRP